MSSRVFLANFLRLFLYIHGSLCFNPSPYSPYFLLSDDRRDEGSQEHKVGVTEIFRTESSTTRLRFITLRSE